MSEDERPRFRWTMTYSVLTAAVVVAVIPLMAYLMWLTMFRPLFGG